MKFLEWFIKDETQKKWAELGGYTAAPAVLKSDEFQNATPYNKAFYETMFKVKDFWATPGICGAADRDEPAASIPISRATRARPRKCSTRSPPTGTRRFKKYGTGEVS